MKKTKNKEDNMVGSLHEMLDFTTKIEEAHFAKQMKEAKRKLWCDVYVAYVGSSNSIKNNARTWADEAVKEFEERFNQ